MKALFAMLVAFVLSTYSHFVMADWLMFKGTEERTHVLTAQFPEELVLERTLRVPTLTVASPVLHSNNIIVSGLDGVIYSLDLDNDKLNWLLPTNAPIRSTPALEENTGYVLNEAGHFIAFDVRTGVITWTFQTQGEQRFSAYGYLGIRENEPVVDPWDYYASSPIIQDEMVIFGSSDSHVYALNKTNGDVVWAFKAKDIIHSSPAIWRDLVVIGSWDGTIYALNGETGELAWEFETGKDGKTHIWRGIQASAAIYEDTIYIGSRDGFMYSIDAQSGEKNWRYDMARSWVLTTAAVNKDFVYIGSSDTGLVIALNRQTGTEAWRYTTGGWNYSSPVLLSNAVIFGSALGRVVALQPETGEELWKSDLGAYLTDTFEILTAEGRLNGNAHNGTRNDALYGLMHRVLASGGFLASPAWVDGKLYLVSSAGEIHIFDASSTVQSEKNSDQ